MSDDQAYEGDYEGGYDDGGQGGYDGGSAVLRRPAEQEISFLPTMFFLVIGLLPIGMFFQFWLRSGTGMNLALVGYAWVLLGCFLMALNYFLYYRQNKPRSALQPAGFWSLVVAIPMLFGGSYFMLATAQNVGVTLSPGPKIETSQLPSVVAKVIGISVSPGMMKPMNLPPRKKLDLAKQKWLVKWPYMDGALWGALGYAVPFGIAGLIFGILRREIPDPRDEHIGVGPQAAVVRAAVGLYYGSAMGFALGAALIGIVRFWFPHVGPNTPGVILHWVYTLGAASNPNMAFQYAFSTGCVLVGAMSLFGGRADFTVTVSDPKAAELTRPVEVNIPEVPLPPQMPFDMGRVQQESRQILDQFQGELAKMFGGPEWEYERYDMPAVGKLGKKPEPEATNLISARNPDIDDDDSPTAMGSLSNVYVEIVADLGKLEIAAADWLTLAEGAILELPKSRDGTINVSINGKPAGSGRPLTVNGNKAVKVISLKQRVEKMVRQ